MKLAKIYVLALLVAISPLAVAHKHFHRSKMPCTTLCELLLNNLGTAPTGLQVKRFFNVDTILFQDDIKYNYTCTLDNRDSAQVGFIPESLSPEATGLFPHWQLPSYIHVELTTQKNLVHVKIPS